MEKISQSPKNETKVIQVRRRNQTDQKERTGDGDEDSRDDDGGMVIVETWEVHGDSGSGDNSGGEREG